MSFNPFIIKLLPSPSPLDGQSFRVRLLTLSAKPNQRNPYLQSSSIQWTQRFLKFVYIPPRNCCFYFTQKLLFTCLPETVVYISPRNCCLYSSQKLLFTFLPETVVYISPRNCCLHSSQKLLFIFLPETVVYIPPRNCCLHSINTDL